MRSLITGIHGFVGGYMAALLQKGGHDVIGGPRNIDEEFIKKVKPHFIYHFAGQSSNLDSFSDPVNTFKINLIETLNLLESVKKAKINPKILFMGSSEEYGKVGQENLPVNESAELKPQNPYSVSKIGASLLCYQYATAYGLKIIRVRSFNLEGPGRQERYAISSFCKQIIEIELGIKKPEIIVGNLSIKRDFLDVRDAARALQLILNKGESGEVYNVCSMTPKKLREVLNLAIKLSGAKNIKIKIDPNKIRNNEMRVFYGNNSKLIKKTHWKPEIPVEKTIEDMLNYWRINLK